VGPRRVAVLAVIAIAVIVLLLAGQAQEWWAPADDPDDVSVDDERDMLDHTTGVEDSDAPTLAGTLADGETPKPREAPVRKAPAHEGEFAFHYKQGYSFLERELVDAKDADLVFETCAGGISSVTLTVPGGGIANASPLRVELKEAKTAPGLYDGLVRGHPDTLKLRDRMDGGTRPVASDVFIAKTRRGEWVKLAIVHRESTVGDWTKTKATIVYSLNPDGPVFLPGSGDLVKAGFEFDTASITDGEHAIVAKINEEKAAKEEPYRRHVAALDERAADLQRSVRSAGAEGHRVSAVVTRQRAKELGTANTYAASTYSFEHDTRDDAKKTGNDWDFAFNDSSDGGTMRVRTVTDDRSEIWDLGPIDFDAALRGDFNPVEPSTYAAAIEGHLYALHTLDTESDYWILLKVLELTDDGMIFEWMRVEDPTVLRRLLVPASKDLKAPYARIQVRSDHGGGNPHRAFLDGTKNAYIDKMSPDPLDLRASTTTERGSRAFVQGGFVPEGRVFVVESVEVTIHLDKPSSTRSVVQVGPYPIVLLTSRGAEKNEVLLYSIDRGREVIATDDLPLRRTFGVKIPIGRDQENSVYVEGASYTRNDVHLRGRFDNAGAAPAGAALWTANDHWRAREVLRLAMDPDRSAAGVAWVKQLDGHLEWLRTLRSFAIDDAYRRQLDALIEGL